MAEKFDAVVIGGGPGGYVCAIRLAQLGKKTACIESRGSLGGTCLNVGCIPSKSLLNLSENFHKAKNFDKIGIELGSLKLNLPKMMKNKEKAVTVLTKGIEFLFKKNKVSYFKGTGSIIGNNQVSVKSDDNKEEKIETKNIIIATGSDPVSLPGIKFDEEKIVSSTGALSLKEVPKKLVVVGGGYIGLEIAATFRQIGLEVSVVEVADRLLARVASPPVAELLAGLHQERGVVLYTGTGVEEVFQNNGLFSGVKLTDGTNLVGDILVVGIGVTPDSDLALQAGIETETTAGGAVLVDEYQLTSDLDVFAIGDVAFQRGSPLRLESIHNAQESGARAAAAIMGKPLPAVQAPWFWSDQYDANLQSVGIVPMGDRNVYQVIRGEFPEKRASFWSYRDKKLLAVEAVRDGASFMLGKKCLEENISPNPSLISDLEFDPMAWILKNSA